MKQEPEAASTLMWSYIALMALLATTWALSFVHTGPWALPISLVIGLAKALVVVLVFMEVRHQEKITKVAVLTGFYFLTILGVLAMADYVTRTVARGV